MAVGEGSESQEANTRKTVTMKCKDSFKGADKNLNITIDADAIVPKGKVPVVEVKPCTIPMEQVKAMAEVFFRKNTVYEPQVVMTKTKLEEKILELKKIISDEATLLKNYNGNKEAADKRKENYKERIVQYEKMHATAPKTITPKEIDWTFRPEFYYMDKVEAQAELDFGGYKAHTAMEFYNRDAFQAVATVNGYHAAIQVYNDAMSGGMTGAGFGMGSNVSGNFAWWSPLDDSRPMKMTQEEAIAMVYDALAEIGITNIQLSDCEVYGKPEPYIIPSIPGLSEEEAALVVAAGDRLPVEQPTEGEDIYGYSMTFMPAYDGIAVYGGIYVHDIAEFYGRDSLYKPYYNDSLLVNVANEIITYFSWNGPMQQVVADNQNAAALSVKEAEAIFKKQMQSEYSISKLLRNTLEQEDFEDYHDYEDYVSNIDSREIHITDIRIGYMPMCTTDRPDECRMVPAWMFLGSEELNFKEDNSELQNPKSDILFPYVIINAIDGSIIDISK